jgi:tetratricopeptide (TPR) repeat protein
MRQAVHAARTAIDCDPMDADGHYALGRVLYWHDPCEREDALRSFEEATRLDPDHQWARLYVAHCLHDLERWSEASDAYGRVSLSAFDGPTGWRRELLREQRAYCMLRSGRRDEALAAFADVVRRRESAFDRTEDQLLSDTLFVYPYLLEEAAAGELSVELGERVAALLVRYRGLEL